MADQTLRRHLLKLVYLFIMGLLAISLLVAAAFQLPYLIPIIPTPTSRIIVADNPDPSPHTSFTQEYIVKAQPTQPATQPPSATATVRIPDKRTPMPTSTLPIATPSPTSIAYPIPFPLVNNENGEVLVRTWGTYPGPSTWPDSPIPPPVGVIPKPGGQINVLLLGNDYRPGKGKRTDVTMLLTLNPNTGTASVTSFPRDLWVYAPGYTMMRINTIFARGGFGLMATAFEYNFGIRPDHYVNIQMNTFKQVIDILGGIDVYVTKPFEDPKWGDGGTAVGPGVVHMNGGLAAWYARSRTGTDDFDRNRRQQEVLKAIFEKLISMDGIIRAFEIYDMFDEAVKTSLTFDELFRMIPLAWRLSDTSRVSRHAISWNEVIAWENPRTGAQVLIPKRSEILLILLEAIAE